MLAGDTPFHAKQRKLMGEAIYKRQMASADQGFLRIHNPEIADREELQDRRNQPSRPYPRVCQAVEGSCLSSC